MTEKPILLKFTIFICSRTLKPLILLAFSYLYVVTSGVTQWGSKYLGDQGYSAIEILRYYYGNDMYINIAEEISGIPASWPRYDLDLGASGEKVTQIQEQLNAVAKAYPALPPVEVTGNYNEDTKESVKKFQEIFGLSPTGIIDYLTWYKIQEIYVAVTRIAELN